MGSVIKPWARVLIMPFRAGENLVDTLVDVPTTVPYSWLADSVIRISSLKGGYPIAPESYLDRHTDCLLNLGCNNNNENNSIFDTDIRLPRAAWIRFSVSAYSEA